MSCCYPPCGSTPPGWVWTQTGWTVRGPRQLVPHLWWVCPDLSLPACCSAATGTAWLCLLHAQALPAHKHSLMRSYLPAGGHPRPGCQACWGGCRQGGRGQCGGTAACAGRHPKTRRGAQHKGRLAMQEGEERAGRERQCQWRNESSQVHLFATGHWSLFSNVCWDRRREGSFICLVM